MTNFDREVAYYDAVWASAEVSASEESRIRQILRMVPADVETVLDVGCGDGRVTNRFPGHMDIVALDFSREGLAHVKAPKIMSHTHALPFADNSFDLVLIADVLEHLKPDEFCETLQEIKRVARTYILINSPNREKLSEARAECQTCRNTFHMNLHVRSLSPAWIQKAFADTFAARTVRFSEERWPYQNIIITILKHHLFREYRYFHMAMCPHCGSKLQKRNVGRLALRCLNVLALLNSGIAIARKFIGMKDGSVEFFVLLQRRQLTRSLGPGNSATMQGKVGDCS